MAKKLTGQKRPPTISIADVAREAGVSPSTVSRALNSSGYVSESVKVRIHTVAERLRYSPNPIGRALRTRRTRTVAVVIPDISNPYYSRVVEGIEEVAVSKGYDFLIACTFYDEVKIATKLTNLRTRLVDGYIFIHAFHCAKDMRLLIQEGFPVVTVDHSFGAVPAPNVTVDYTKAYDDAVTMLVELGHREIAFFGISETAHDPIAEEKLAGYVQGMERNGLRVDDDFLYRIITTEINQIDNARRTIFADLPRRKPVTAIAAGSDLMAIGIAKGLKDLGLKVPRDISIVGMDDLLFSEYVEPALTSIWQPKRRKGVHAMQTLIHMIEHPGDPIPSDTVLSTKLVQRASTAERFVSDDSPLSG